MFELIKFSIFFASCILIPGWLMLRITRVKFDLLELGGLSYCLGISVLILASLILRIGGFPFWILYSIGIVSCLKLWKLGKKGFNLSLSQSWRFMLVCLISLSFISIIMVSFHLGSKIDKNSGFLISAGRDNFWRLSIMQELTNHFPPQIPGFSGTLLKNYHFLYDLLIATTHRLTRISIPVVHFQFYSVVMAFGFCLLSYTGAKVLVKNKWIAFLMSMFIVGTGNLSYLLRFISSNYTFIAKSNIFLADSPFDQTHNPFNMLAYALFLSLPVFLAKWVKSQDNKFLIFISITTAVLFGVKIYAGILAVIAIFVVYSYLLIKKRGSLWFLLPVINLLPVIQVMRGNNFAALSWNPGWILMKMIEDRDRLFSENTVLKLQHYHETKNIFRLIENYVKLMCIFIVGNLNVRLLALLIPLRKKWMRVMSTELWLWYLCAIIAAFSIPLLFSQNRAPYDSIQFIPYGLILLSLVSGIIIEKILLSTKKLTIKIMIVIFLFVIAFPTSIVVAHDHLTSPKDVISNSEVSALQYLESIGDTDSIVLTDMDEEKLYLMYVSAISGKRVFLAGVSLTEQLGVNTSERREDLEEFYHYDKDTSELDLNNKRKFLTAANIEYIYLSNSGIQNVPLMDKMKLKVVYKNENVVIYQTK